MFTHLRCAALLLSVGLILAADVFAAERIWDNDLKRFLTQAEIDHAEVFMTEEEAVKIMLAKSERIRKDVLRLSQDQKEIIEQRIGWKFPEDSFEVYIGETGTQVDGYALIQNTIGKHKPMTYMVGVDAQGRVSNVELLVFREARGSEVRT